VFLQPLEALPLEDSQQVTVIITDAPTGAPDLDGYFSPDEWAAPAHNDVSLEEVRRPSRRSPALFPMS
jgi:hypothetical protein